MQDIMPVPESTDLPVRRSILRIPNSSELTTNDDEAERRIRRRTLGNTSVVNSTNDLIEEQEGLRNCLKIYHDNKICKENAWSLTLIDNVSKLVTSHHRSLKNFQIVGSTLDATSKIYGLRVDSVHRDVVRMSSGLGRLKNDTTNNDDDDNQANDDSGALNADNEGAPKEKGPAKKKRVRKLVSTITKNKETLNAKLDTIPQPDPLFSKLNSIMGDVSSSNRLLLNILHTEMSNLKLTLSDPFWDDTDCEPNEYSEKNEYECDEKDLVRLTNKFNMSFRQRLRQQLSGYLITNTPIDDDDEEPPPVLHTSFNQSQIDYAFDINADVEPPPESQDYVMDYDMDDDGGADGVEFNDDDRVAINACKGLRRPTTIISDLRPADTTQLEYSYRPLDNINQFWAGPSYWKFRKSRKLTMNSKEATANTIVNNAVQAGTKRKSGKKIEAITFQFENGDSSRCDEESAKEDGNEFLSVKCKTAQKFKKSNLYKRWDSKKLKLPTDLRIDRNLFDYHTFSPGINIHRADPSATPQTQTSGYDNAEDQEYCSNVQEDDMDRDMDPEVETDIVVPDEIIPEAPDMMEVENNNETVNEIGTKFEGAPEQIQKIDIQFAKRAKVIDMKQMKTCCLASITKQCEKTATRTFVHPKMARPDERYQEGAASFGIIYNSLPHLLSKTMAENLSPSVAFYSILHLANEHRLRLYKTSKVDETNVFLIRRLD